METLLCHLVGDYVLQSDWMASTKTKSVWAAVVHAFTYTLPFLVVTRSWKALLLIFLTHAVIDHFRLARYVCWAKNFLAPRWIKVDQDSPSGVVNSPGRNEAVVRNYPWSDCQATGYGPDKPLWMSVWLLILADNTMHLLCNYLAIRFF